MDSTRHKMHAQADINTHQMKQIVPHKNRRQSFSIFGREIRTSDLDDRNNRYYVERVEIFNFSKEIYKLKIIVRSKTSIARIQLTQ